MTLTLFSRPQEHLECQILTKKLVLTLSLEAVDQFRPNLFDCIIGMGKRLKLKTIVGRASDLMMARHKVIYFSWLGLELFCLLLGLLGFNCWFSFAPVFQWCCSTPQRYPGVGGNTLFLSSPHLCFIIVFICD